MTVRTGAGGTIAAGGLSADANNPRHQAEIRIQVHGSLIVALRFPHQAAVTIHGSGGLSVDPRLQRHQASLRVQGSGSLSVDTHLKRQFAQVRIQGLGSLSVTLHPRRQDAAVTFEGSADLSVDAFSGGPLELPTAQPPDWPVDLVFIPYQPETTGFTITPVDEVLRTDMDAGPPRIRRRFTSIQHRVSFDVIMEPQQFMMFKGFYTGTLNHGTRQFRLPIWTGVESIDHRARFESPYQVNDYAIDMSRVRFSLVVYEMVG